MHVVRVCEVAAVFFVDDADVSAAVCAAVFFEFKGALQVLVVFVIAKFKGSPALGVDDKERAVGVVLGGWARSGAHRKS